MAVRRTIRCATAILVAVVSIAAAGCRDTPRVPRIEPVLHHWASAYRGVPGIALHAFSTGSIEMPAGAIHRGASWLRKRKLDVPAYVIEHPEAGLVVFDTGLSPRVHEDPKEYLGFLPSAFATFSMARGQSLPVQMKAAGFAPKNVRFVVLSHTHFDHTGTVEAFPDATVVIAKGERGGHGLLGAFHKREDVDGVAKWLEIDYAAAEPYATFSGHHDLLGDGSLVLVDLGGHTPGSHGLIAHTPGGPVLLTGDAVPVDESWRYPVGPGIAENGERWWEHLWRIKKFAQLVPSLTIAPGHDLKGLARSELPEIIEVHEFTPGSGDTDASAALKEPESLALAD